MAFFRNLFRYKRDAQPSFEESQKYWVEEQFRKIERSINSMQDVYNPSYIGAFRSTVDQSCAAINTPTAVTVNATDFSFGVYVGTPASRIYFDNPGYYNLQFSLQIVQTGGSSAQDVTIWLRQNGVDVANSATRVHIQGPGAEAVAAWNFTGIVKTNDYLELMWSTTDTGVILLHENATAIHPAIPSVLLDVTQIAQ